MSKLHSYHSDLDGIGGKILSLYFGLDYDKYIQLDYDFERTSDWIKEEIFKYDEVVFTDFCPSKEYLEKLLELGKKVFIADHHESSLWIKEMSHPNLTVHHDKMRSGTKIYFYEFIKPLYSRIPQVVYDFVDRVDVYDLWLLESPLREEAENLNRLLYKRIAWNADPQIQYDPFVDNILKKLDYLSEWKWTEEDLKAIKSAKDKEMLVYKQSMKMLQTRTDERGLKFGLFKASSKISIICSMILTEYAGLDYIIAINTFSPTEYKLSLRSKGFDVTQLENVSGHKEAGATKFETKEQLDEFWENTNKSIPYKLQER